MDGLVVARAIAGDREVLGGVLTALERPLYRYISNLVTRREMAEDVLQEVLFRICRKIGWLRDPELLRPWAFRIASRECFRQLRSERQRGEEVLDLDTLETAANGSIPQGWEPRLLDWIDGLPPASRAVIVLHYLEEMSLDEAAAVLEILPGTAKSRLAYGLARLRARGQFANECWRRSSTMTEQPWNNASRNALDRIDRSERRFCLFVILLVAVEMLFLWGFVRLAEFSNPVHVLIFWSTVSTYTLLMFGLAILWGHVSRNTRLVLKAIDLSTHRFNQKG
jgi:RNA polymerase sigma-70 factor (ECF subfamily)